jgi:hypothetical protein
MAMSRTDTSADAAQPPRRDVSMRGGPLQLTLDNFSPPILLLAVVGLGILLIRGRAAGGSLAPLWVLIAVGGAWLALFWPQFVRHNYWQFYLGPPAAVCAAVSVVGLHDVVRRFAERRLETGATKTGATKISATIVAEIVGAALLAAVVLTALRGTDDYFQRRSFPAERVRALESLARSLKAEDVVLLYENLVDYDRRGLYIYRNLAPPHLPCYLDRTCAVVRDKERFERQRHRAAVWLIPVELWNIDDRARRLVDEVAGGYPKYIQHHYLVVDLKPYLKINYGQILR